MRQIKLDFTHTLQLLKCFDIHYKYQNRLSTISRCISQISNKQCFKKNNITVSYNEKSTELTLTYPENLFTELFIEVDNNLIFAPILYYMYQNIQRIGRMIVYKKDRKCTKYLVHRAKVQSFDNPLEHPGGHIEYFETNLNNQILSGRLYIENIVEYIFNKKQLDLLHNDILHWVLAGTLRELNEESGIIVKNYHNLQLLKIGSKTHYFSLKLDTDIKELGPGKKFRHELYIGHEATSKASCFLKCENKYCVLLKEENESSNLNSFWDKHQNIVTLHAWITAENMRRYWQKEYLQHINAVIEKTNS